MMGKFSCLCCRLLTFSKSTFLEILSESNCLDSDQDRHYAGPDLNPNCLQRLSIDKKKSLLAGKELSNAVNSSMILVGCDLEHKQVSKNRESQPQIIRQSIELS